MDWRQPQFAHGAVCTAAAVSLNSNQQFANSYKSDPQHVGSCCHLERTGAASRPTRGPLISRAYVTSMNQITMKIQAPNFYNTLRVIWLYCYGRFGGTC
jgi:hypothetical protein